MKFFGNIIDLTFKPAIEELGGSHDRGNEKVWYSVEYQSVWS